MLRLLPRGEKFQDHGIVQESHPAGLSGLAGDWLYIIIIIIAIIIITRSVLSVLVSQWVIGPFLFSCIWALS